MRGILFMMVVFGAIPWGSEARVSGDFYLERAVKLPSETMTFNYMSNDGTLQLACSHAITDPALGDWDVWCGKGTPWFRQFRVHFLVRLYKSSHQQRSAYEILYWVIDRQQPLTKAFASMSSWIQFKNISDLDKLVVSQGVENDYAYLTLELKIEKI